MLNATHRSSLLGFLANSVEFVDVLDKIKVSHQVRNRLIRSFKASFYFLFDGIGLQALGSRDFIIKNTITLEQHFSSLISTFKCNVWHHIWVSVASWCLMNRILRLHTTCVCEESPCRFSDLFQGAIALRVFRHFILVQGHLILSLLQEINSLQVVIALMDILTHFLTRELWTTNTAGPKLPVNSIIEWKFTSIEILKALGIKSCWVLELTLVCRTDHVPWVIDQETLGILS